MTATTLDAAAKGRLAERMVPVAAALACAVREECADSIGEVLEPFSRQELYGLLVVLAGMVSVDQPLEDLLAWVTWDEQGHPLPPGAEMVLFSRRAPYKRRLEPCGTHAAAQRHRYHGEELDPECQEALRKYDRERVRARRAA